MNYVYASANKPLRLGRRGENEATTVIFPLVDLFGLPDRTCYQLVHQRHGDRDPYPCAFERRGGFLSWVIGSADLNKVGSGAAQLTAFIDDTIAKSIVFSTEVEDSLGAASGVPEAQESWVNQVLQSGAAAARNAEHAAQARADSQEAAEQAAQSAADAEEAAASIVEIDEMEALTNLEIEELLSN